MTDAANPRPDEQSRASALSRREAPGSSLDDLIETIKHTADGLKSDGASRGDVKILARAARELRYAFKVFGRYRDRRKVAIFGSARTRPEEPAYEQARLLGQAMAEQHWMVVTGAAQGIMEAGHLGAGREHSMGLNILLPFEQSANEVIAGDFKLVHMKYFFTRKLMFVKECDAVVCLPGGFGTMDEAIEVLTLLQTGKRDMAPVVLLDEPGGDYWSAVDNFIRGVLVPRGLISEEDLSLYRVSDDWRTARDEILTFFRVYHSMRFVGPNVLLRLNHRLPDALTARVGEQFSDIVDSGGFQQREAEPGEDDEPWLASLPRLVFRFHRIHCGRLRQLIDMINREGSGTAEG